MMRRRAFSLIELLVVMALLGLVLALGSRVFVQTVRATRDARVYERDVALIEHTLRTLRADVWSATQISVPAADRLELSDLVWTATRDQDAAGRAVTVLRRGDESFELPARIGFAVLDGAVLVEVDDRVVPLAGAFLIAEARP